MQLSVRDVDDSVFKKFKAWAAEEDMPIGKALTMAMDQFIAWRDTKIKPTDIKPLNLGKRARNLSEEIDKVLYGD
ncbi:MAG: hypothetical protein HY514_04910 [Candidatus Aenigmarchaeota archaeon]|nr:hypothetical protein [Candidatus Aenigmarchaeota archaeon]